MIVLVALTSACTSFLYPPPLRLKEETATIAARMKGVIEVINGHAVKGGGFPEYSVSPGPVDLIVRGHASVQGAVVNTHYYGSPAKLCFTAAAGHTYVVDSGSLYNSWSIEVFDDGVRLSMSSLVCRDDPDRAAWVNDQACNVDPDSQPPLPGTGIYLGWGIAVGGDKLATTTFDNGDTRSVRAGTGFSFSLGSNYTPVWHSRRLGIGLTGEAGWKFGGFEGPNAKAFLYGIPVSIGLQTFVTINESWYLRIATGPTQTVFGHYSLSETGALNTKESFVSSVGWTSMLGIYWVENWHNAFGLELHTTSLKERIGGQNFDASSIGITSTINFNR